MKSVIVTAVSIISVFAAAEGRNFPAEPGEQVVTTDEAQVILPNGIEWLGTDEAGRNSHNGPETNEEHLQFGENNALSDGIDSFSQQKDSTLNERKGNKTSCKAKSPCVLLGGSCVTNATLCSGRLIEGCKGKNCQCCVPDILGAKFEKLEEELKTFKSNLSSELRYLKDNTHNMASNLSTKLNNVDSSINSQLSNMNSSLHSNLAYLATRQGCPLAQGYFVAPGTTQCFKYIKTQTTWSAANSNCISQGLVLAKVNDPVIVRKYFLERYGNYDNIWIGAKGDGSKFVWQRDGVAISNTSPLWYNGHPGFSYSTSHCLTLGTLTSWMTSYPNQPFFGQGCTSPTDPSLCELILE